MFKISYDGHEIEYQLRSEYGSVDSPWVRSQAQVLAPAARLACYCQSPPSSAERLRDQSLRPRECRADNAALPAPHPIRNL